MTEHNWEHIIQLTLEEMNDIISDKDKAYLYHLIAEDEKVYQLYMRTHSQLGSDKVRRILEESSKKRQVKTFTKFAVRQAKNWWLAMLLIVVIKTVFVIVTVLYLDRMYMKKKMKAAQISTFSPEQSSTFK